MIYTYIPYTPIERGKDLGWAYNNFMEHLKDDDWAIFLDHDAMFTTTYWYHQICEIIKFYPDAGELTGVTNRIGNPIQLVNNIDRDNHDIKYHRKIGLDLYNQRKLEVHEYTNRKWGLSGFVIVTSKKAWKAVGGFKSGFLGVDWDYTNRLWDKKIKTYIMGGVYLYHWYRGDGDTSHIK